MSDQDLFPYPRGRLQAADLDLASSLQAMVQKEIMDKRLELKEDYDGLLAPSLAKLMAEVGLQKMFWPDKLGGEEHNEPEASYTIAAALEQIGRADVGLAFLAAHSLALQAAVAAKENYQEGLCTAMAPLFCEGDKSLIVSFVLPAFSEDDGAPLWRGKGIQVKAKSGPDGWTLNGKGARPTCSGADAGLFGVLCAVEGDEPAFILVPGNTPGLSRGEEFLKTGLAASRNADLDFSDVKVPEVNCAWRGDEGTYRLLSWYYLGLAAAGAGALLAVYEIIKEWGDNRVIKGRGHIFKENPLTGALMGEIAKEIAVDRLLAYDLAGILAEPEGYGGSEVLAAFTSALMLVHHIYVSAEYTIHRTMELMASAGYAKEWQLERYWRDVKTVQCYLGAYELAKHDFARWFYQAKTL
ncbi:MAG: acyl-CoA/acyl-ACP dehydrogenase [Actinobacteria bacterium]|nr:acyl-CoA/acyl-ACP dehydrogenase [Actinomycetota bacterium]